MSTIAKPPALSFLELGTQLFDQLGTLFSLPKAPTAKSVAVEVKKSVRKLQERSPEELLALRTVFHEITTQIDELMPTNINVDFKPKFDVSKDEFDQAQREEAVADLALQALRAPARRQTPTAKSIREGNAAMAQAELDAAAAIQERIEKRELISSAELQSALKINRQAVSGAMKAGRLFALVGPSGKNYYPAFYADPKLDRRAVEQVAKALGTLPAASKYYFFTQKFTRLQATPLEALRKGRLTQVLEAAAAFVER